MIGSDFCTLFWSRIFFYSAAPCHVFRHFLCAAPMYCNVLFCNLYFLCFYSVLLLCIYCGLPLHVFILGFFIWYVRSTHVTRVYNWPFASVVLFLSLGKFIFGDFRVLDIFISGQIQGSKCRISRHKLFFHFPFETEAGVHEKKTDPKICCRASRM